MIPLLKRVGGRGFFRMDFFLATLVLLVIGAQLARDFGDIPCGLFYDEAAIGHDAHSIRTSGRDQFDTSWPLYFRSLGDYKSPLYIYASAFLFHFVRPGDAGVRLAAPLFFAAYLIVLFFLLRRLLPAAGRTPAIVLVLLGAGFSPWLFPMARIAFEVIAQPVCFVIALYWIHRAFESKADADATQPDHDSPRPAFAALIAGCLTGLSLYAYATSRLFSFVLALSVVLLYGRRRMRSVLYFAAGFALLCLPYAVYLASGGAGATARLKAISFLFDDGIGPAGKAVIFGGVYLSYLDPAFLMFHGDENMRHGVGQYGVVQVWVFLSGLAGIVVVLIGRRKSPDRFAWLLLVMLLAAPGGGALAGDPGHALRGILMPVMLLIFAAIGIKTLHQLRARSTWLYAMMLALISIAAVYESRDFVRFYFDRYPHRSAWAFGGWGLRQRIQAAVGRDPRRIYIVSADHPDTRLQHMALYRIADGIDVPLELRVAPANEAGTCEVRYLDAAMRLVRAAANDRGTCGPEHYQFDLVCFPGR